jgi:hypothetical protein
MTAHMNRIVFRLLLSLALILQGSVAAFGAVRSHDMHGSCCPHAASSSSDADSSDQHGCPCPQKQPCASDCQLMCASAVAVAIEQFPQLEFMTARAAPLAYDTDSVPPRITSPPTRPPIS